MMFAFLEDIIFQKDSVQILHQPIFEEKIKTLCNKLPDADKKITGNIPFCFICLRSLWLIKRSGIVLKKHFHFLYVQLIFFIRVYVETVLHDTGSCPDFWTVLTHKR